MSENTRDDQARRRPKAPPAEAGSGLSLTRAGDVELVRDFADLLPLTAAQERLLEASTNIRLNPATIDDACFQHAVFCQVGLPRKRTTSLRFERTNGAVSLLIKAGELKEHGQWVQHALPYGPKPRLILIYAITEALKTRSPIVSIGKTAAEFMERIGIEPQGSEYRSINRQLKALAACEMRLGISYAGVDRTKLLQTFDHIDLLSRHPDQQTLWTKELEFTTQFFASICEHSVPLREEAVAELRGTALGLDVYSWLAHRLHRIKSANGINIRWEALKAQFGQEYSRLDHFKEQIRETLRRVAQVYPQARLSEGREGLTLRQSPPPIPPKVTITVPMIPER